MIRLRTFLYLLVTGLVVNAGFAAVNSARQAAEQFRIHQIAQCMTVNEVAPESCQMPR